MKARDNPFAADRVVAMPYIFTGESWPVLMERLSRLHYRAAIVGPCGSGKTTLLADLQTRLHARGFHVKPLRLDRSRPALDAVFDTASDGGELARFYRLLAPSDVILLDGAEQLTRRAWTDFSCRTACAAGLIVTTHRPGLLPTLIECRPTAPLLDDLMTRLLDGCPPEHLPALRGQLPSARDLCQRHNGNVRAALRELYDRCAEQH